MENKNPNTKIKILDPEDVDFANDDNYTIVPSGKKYILVHKDRPTISVKPIILCRGCTVKYAPEKYNKIVINLNQYDAGFFMDFWFKTEKIIPTVQAMTSESIGLKLTDKQKENLKGVKRGSYCDVAFQFNEIWKVGDKWYSSYILKQYTPVAEPVFFT